MNNKCKDCNNENKCACYVCSRLERKDMFEPKVVEIRPEKAGELWIYGKIHTMTIDIGAGLRAIDEFEEFMDRGSMIHGKNGWERLFPHVEAMKEYADRILKNMEDKDIERIELEGVLYGNEISVICKELHESIQFFNCSGEKANGMVLKRIRKVLSEMAKDKP